MHYTCKVPSQVQWNWMTSVKHPIPHLKARVCDVSCSNICSMPVCGHILTIPHQRNANVLITLGDDDGTIKSKIFIVLSMDNYSFRGRDDCGQRNHPRELIELHVCLGVCARVSQTAGCIGNCSLYNVIFIVNSINVSIRLNCCCSIH